MAVTYSPALFSFYNWIRSNGWEYHTEGKYWYRSLKYPASSWPPAETATERELFDKFFGEGSAPAMPQVDNLNKQEFWDQLNKDYPQAMKHFCNWIDWYKAANDWAFMFGTEVKYHTIPLAMQIGIFICYYFNLYEGAPDFLIEYDHIDVDGFGDNVREIFKIREHEINNPEA